MEKAAAFVLSMSLTATLLFTGSDACNGVPFISTADVCQPAIIGAAMSELCAATLGVTTTPHEVTAYVAAAAVDAAQSYRATRRVANDEIDDPSAPEGLAGACEACLYKYDAALGVLDFVADHLQSCALGDISRDFTTAAATIDDCATLVLPIAANSSLYAMIVGDRDRTVLAVRLAVLM
ncbi:hypothetical protein ABZP36_029390 [Zizania latifolia]